MLMHASSDCDDLTGVVVFVTMLVITWKKECLILYNLEFSAERHFEQYTEMMVKIFYFDNSWN